ncbi:MAG TPA: hypothetical protein VF014_00620, partial [Casimicrobiaceae bacterium]|nr:hypothetical protein [Casimicrobiaceae bacterium]
SPTPDASSVSAPAANPSMVTPGPATGAEPAKSAAPASTEPPLPGRPATAAQGTKIGSGETKATPSKAPPKAALPGAEAPPKTTQVPAAAPPSPSKAPAKAPAPAVAPAPDRWQMMAEAMTQCAREQFFARLACQQRTRNQYCDGYWGQVAQCPAAPTKDHGQ